MAFPSGKSFLKTGSKCFVRISLYLSLFIIPSTGISLPGPLTVKLPQNITKHLLPVIKNDFPDGNAIFQQDLAPCHTSGKMQKFFKDNKINILQWPGNSPDLNPIENL